MTDNTQHVAPPREARKGDAVAHPTPDMVWQLGAQRPTPAELTSHQPQTPEANATFCRML